MIDDGDGDTRPDCLPLDKVFADIAKWGFDHDASDWSMTMLTQTKNSDGFWY